MVKTSTRSLNGEPLAWMLANFARPGGPSDPCVLWPFAIDDSKNGYGALWIGRHCWRAHAYACFLREGPRPTGALACHSCTNRLCIVHATWGSRSQNNGPDRLRDGTHNRGQRHPMNKLTAVQVLEIVRLIDSGEHNHSIARRYGVHYTTVNQIGKGRIWSWLTGRTPPPQKRSALSL